MDMPSHRTVHRRELALHSAPWALVALAEAIPQQRYHPRWRPAAPALQRLRSARLR